MSSSKLVGLVSATKSRVAANTFDPTPEQRRAKAAYWSHFLQAPGASQSTPPTVPSPEEAERYSGYSQVSQWWFQEGFPEWFSNGEEFRQRVEYISILGLEVLEQILRDTEMKASDRLTAAKIAFEISSKFPKSSSGKEQYLDEKVAEMDRKELEKYINSKLQIVNPD